MDEGDAFASADERLDDALNSTESFVNGEPERAMRLQGLLTPLQYSIIAGHPVKNLLSELNRQLE